MKRLVYLLPGLLLSGCILVAPGLEPGPSASPSPSNRPNPKPASSTTVDVNQPVARPVDNSGKVSDANVVVGAVDSDTAVLALERNMARLPGVVITTSSDYPSWPKARLNDGDLKTSWFTASGDAANLGKSPFIEIAFPQAVTVRGVNLRGNREYASGYDILEGRLTVRTLLGDRTFNIVLPAPDRDFSLRFGFAISGVTSLRFDITEDESNDPGLAELEVDGSR